MRVLVLCFILAYVNAAPSHYHTDFSTPVLPLGVPALTYSLPATSGDIQGALIDAKVRYNDFVQAAKDNARAINDLNKENLNIQGLSSDTLNTKMGLSNALWNIENKQWQSLESLGQSQVELKSALANSAALTASAQIASLSPVIYPGIVAPTVKGFVGLAESQAERERALAAHLSAEAEVKNAQAAVIAAEAAVISAAKSESEKMGTQIMGAVGEQEMRAIGGAKMGALMTGPMAGQEIRGEKMGAQWTESIAGEQTGAQRMEAMAGEKMGATGGAKMGTQWTGSMAVEQMGAEKMGTQMMGAMSGQEIGIMGGAKMGAQIMGAMGGQQAGAMEGAKMDSQMMGAMGGQAMEAMSGQEMGAMGGANMGAQWSGSMSSEQIGAMGGEKMRTQMLGAMGTELMEAMAAEKMRAEKLKAEMSGAMGAEMMRGETSGQIMGGMRSQMMGTVGEKMGMELAGAMSTGKMAAENMGAEKSFAVLKTYGGPSIAIANTHIASGVLPTVPLTQYASIQPITRFVPSTYVQPDCW